jgi:hypothetical protein
VLKTLRLLSCSSTNQQSHPKKTILADPAGELGKTTQFGDPHRGNWPRKCAPQRMQLQLADFIASKKVCKPACELLLEKGNLRGHLHLSET